ncbi:hypothetical protein MTP99_006277 [Tenebrio molitor]|jgi:hypothetical protein|nr:hypothetical protein MTP99_006277 [Tenebrio molitor]
MEIHGYVSRPEINIPERCTGDTFAVSCRARWKVRAGVHLRETAGISGDRKTAQDDLTPKITQRNWAVH